MAYNDMYNDFWCCNIPYDFPYSFEERNKIYLQGKQIPYWIWNVGDNTTMKFDLEKLWTECPCCPEMSLDDIDPNEYCLEITFYNFRYEKILQELLPFSKTPEFEITVDMSKDVFSSAGVYYCSLVLKTLLLKDENADGEDENLINEIRRTIINRENCLIFVR